MSRWKSSDSELDLPDSFEGWFSVKALREFWNIEEIFSKGEIPTEEGWNELFNTPGYSVLIEIEFERDLLIRNISQAFIPWKNITTDQSKDRLINHFRSAREKKKEINQTVLELLKQKDLGAEALNLTNSWLPKKADHLPPVSFLIFDYDARGYDPIIIDALWATENTDEVLGLLTHEFFHHYAGKLLVYRSKTEGEKSLINAIKQIQEEGIADHIYRMKNNGSKDRGYNSSKIIDRISDLAETKNYDKLGAEIWRILPRSGHVIGFYMVEKILEEVEKDRLIQTVGNPVDFFNLYNKVTDKSGFSKEFIEKIERL